MKYLLRIVFLLAGAALLAASSSLPGEAVRSSTVDATVVAMSSAVSNALSATAVTSEPCSTLQGSATGAGANNGYYEQTNKEENPANPAFKTCENGRIVVQVYAKRVYGYRIGDTITIQLLVDVDRAVRLDMSTLKQGKLTFTGDSSFELAAPPEIVERPAALLRVEYVVVLKVRSFEAKPNLPFRVDLRYATESVGGKLGTASWKILSSPPYTINTSPTLDQRTELEEGDMTGAVPQEALPARPFFFLGVVLILTWPLYLFGKTIRTAWRKRSPTPAGVAWQEFDRVLILAQEQGYTTETYTIIARTLKQYLRCDAATTAEVLRQLKEHPKVTAIESVLLLLDQALYGEVAPNSAQNLDLIHQLEQIVPKPDREL